MKRYRYKGDSKYLEKNGIFEAIGSEGLTLIRDEKGDCFISATFLSNEDIEFFVTDEALKKFFEEVKE